MIKYFRHFFVLLFLFSKSLADEESENGKDHLLCKQCGHTVSNGEHLIEHRSSLAEKYWNQTVLNDDFVTVQLFINPQKRKFNVITLASADLYVHEQAFTEASWFPGFAWKICQCPKCGSHLGWKFQPVGFNHVTHTEKDTFFGLILDNLLEEIQSETLLLVPKSYLS